jgi:hypothetical protein
MEYARLLKALNQTMCKECVYFIGSTDLDCMKVGRTQCDTIVKRLGSIQCGNPSRLSVVAAIGTVCAIRTERDMHRELSSWRLRGEWFEFSEIMERTIRRNADYIDSKLLQAISLHSIGECDRVASGGGTRVAVVRFKDRPALQMRYRNPLTGCWITRSTRTSNRRDAERVAARWESELCQKYSDLDRLKGIT